MPAGTRLPRGLGAPFTPRRPEVARRGMRCWREGSMHTPTPGGRIYAAGAPCSGSLHAPSLLRAGALGPAGPHPQQRCLPARLQFPAPGPARSCPRVTPPRVCIEERSCVTPPRSSASRIPRHKGVGRQCGSGRIAAASSARVAQGLHPASLGGAEAPPPRRVRPLGERGEAARRRVDRGERWRSRSQGSAAAVTPAQGGAAAPSSAQRW
jgi:hypothetical protein